MKRILFITAILAIAGEKSYSETHTARLENSIITDTNFETTVIDTPKNVTIITKEEIEERGVQNISEALKNVPNLNIKNLGGGDATFDLRGQGATAKSNVLVMKDGTPLNSIDLSGYKTSQIDISTVERIEVIPSGGSVLYGDGAIGGVINIITKAPEDRKNYGSVGVEGGSYDLLKFYGNYGTKIGENLLIDTNYSTRNKGGYRDYSKDNLDDLEIKAKYILADGEITFGYGHTEDSFKAPGSLTKEEVEENPKQTGKNLLIGKNIENTYSVNFRKEVAERVEFLLYSSYREREYNSHYSSWSEWKSQRSDKSETEYVKPQIRFGYGEKNHITVGGDLYGGKTEDIKGNINKQRSEGIFALNSFAYENLELTQGYRRQFIKYDIEGFKKKKFNEDALNLAANYLLNQDSSIYLSYVTAFRTPKTNELTWWKGDFEPQKSQTYEIGGKTLIGNSFISLAVFYVQTENEIIYDSLIDKKNRNLEGTNERIGGEISFEHYFDRLTLRENFSIIDSELKESVYSGKTMPEIPRYMANFGLTYRATDELITNLDINYRGKYYHSGDFENESSRVKDFVTADLNLNYNFHSGVTLYGGVKNIFDKKYFSHAGENSYYPADGRSIYLGAKYRF